MVIASLEAVQIYTVIKTRRHRAKLTGRPLEFFNIALKEKP
jgi:hypothetical protein